MTTVRRAVRVAAWGFLGAAAAISFLLPRDLAVPTALASAEPDSYTLFGVLHDFRSSHPDMNVVPGGGYGHYAGNVVNTLQQGVPAFFGIGSAHVGETVIQSEPWTGTIGEDTAFVQTAEPDDYNWNEIVLATKVTIPFDVTVESMSALVGQEVDEVRFAVFTDGGGQPGTLVAQTGKAPTIGTGMAWVTIPLPELTILAGDYWLLLALEDDDQHYAYNDAGGTTLQREVDWVDGSGFPGSWGSGGAPKTMVPSLYLTATQTNVDVEHTGNSAPLPTLSGGYAGEQVAAKVSMPEDGTLLGVTAYVGGADADVAFAVYADDGGEPGALIAESLTDVTTSAMGWMTLFVPDTPLVAGDYWLAVSLESATQQVAIGSGGAMRRVTHGATSSGFLPTWGTSSAAAAQQMSIYGTYRTGSGFAVARGYKVTDQYRDAQNRPIAPILSGVGSDDNIEFSIINQAVVPGDDFAVEVRVLGAAIQTGSAGYHLPVTMQMNIGGTNFEPFGAWLDPVNGNVNDNQDVTCNSNGTNPRCAAVSGPFAAGSAVHVRGRSWKKQNTSDPCLASTWEAHRTSDTVDDSIQIAVLRNGDPIPEISALYSQSSISEYLEDFIDVETDTMVMTDNQIIYLFELGTSGDSSSADFQDLVVLVTLGSDTSSMCGATPPAVTSLCGTAFGDVEGTLLSAEDADASGGVTSPATFAEWFRPKLGKNLAIPYHITLVDDGTGVYEFATSAFHPADDKGYGNEGESHNHYFTYSVQAMFTYEECAGQFVWFDGDDDAFLFVNNRLVMDRGGVRPGVSQHVQLDRLGLTDGQSYDLRFFFAQRQSLSSEFHLRTNLNLRTNAPIVISDAFD